MALILFRDFLGVKMVSSPNWSVVFRGGDVCLVNAWFVAAAANRFSFWSCLLSFAICLVVAVVSFSFCRCSRIFFWYAFNISYSQYNYHCESCSRDNNETFDMIERINLPHSCREGLVMVQTGTLTFVPCRLVVESSLNPLLLQQSHLDFSSGRISSPTCLHTDTAKVED